MDYTRQTDVFNPSDFIKQVHIIGCGATGSWVALLLDKIGVKKLHLWDFDTVEEHNIPNQNFTVEDIGKYKVDALADKLVCEVIRHTEKVNKDTEGLSGVVFMLTDTMHSREEIYRKVLKNNIGVDLLVETRMGLNGGRIYAINPCSKSNCEEYEKTLYKDEDASRSLCGVSQSIAPTAMLTASYAVWQMLKWHNGLLPQDEDFDNEVLFDCQFNQLLTKGF